VSPLVSDVRLTNPHRTFFANAPNWFTPLLLVADVARRCWGKPNSAVTKCKVVPLYFAFSLVDTK
jgi:hypothetical protein